MARKARKTAQTLPSYVIDLKEKDIVERQSFGHFEIIRFKTGIMFKEWGYYLFTTPYAVDETGNAQEKNLYRWLTNLLEFSTSIKGREQEKFDENMDATNEDVLYGMIIMTEANLEHPITSFVDEDRASDFAVKRMEWLNTMMLQLQDSMNAPVGDETEEEVKSNIIDIEKARLLQESLNILTDGIDLDDEIDNLQKQDKEDGGK